MFKQKLMLLIAAAALLSVPRSGLPVRAAKPSGSIPPGTIYCALGEEIYTMKGDGSGKQLVPGVVRTGDEVAVSRDLHGGRRWFVMFRETESNGEYLLCGHMLPTAGTGAAAT